MVRDFDFIIRGPEVPTDRQALTLLDSDGTRLRLLSRDRVSNLLTFIYEMHRGLRQLSIPMPRNTQFLFRTRG